MQIEGVPKKVEWNKFLNYAYFDIYPILLFFGHSRWSEASTTIFRFLNSIMRGCVILRKQLGIRLLWFLKEMESPLGKGEKRERVFVRLVDVLLVDDNDVT